MKVKGNVEVAEVSVRTGPERPTRTEYGTGGSSE